MHCNNTKGDERIKEVERALRGALIGLTILLIIYFISDICSSYINVCIQVNGNYICKLEPVINFIPKISKWFYEQKLNNCKPKWKLKPRGVAAKFP